MQNIFLALALVSAVGCVYLKAKDKTLPNQYSRKTEQIIADSDQYAGLLMTEVILSTRHL